MESEYSCELLNPKNVFSISNNFVIIPLKNNGESDWPENEAKLVCHKTKSSFKFNDTILPPLKSGESKDIKLEMIIPSGLAWRTYQVYMNFNVKGENYGNEIMAYMNRVSEFRNDFYKKHGEYREEDIMEYYRNDDCHGSDMCEWIRDYLRSDYG